MTRLIIRLFVAVMVTVGLTAGCAEAGWSSVDIGSVGATGSVSGTYTVNGAGADIWGYADAFRFVYTTLSGDGTVVTQVTSEEYVADWTKAGVMMRETLSAGSRHASVFVTPGSKGIAFQRRLSTGGASTHTSGGSGRAPYWVKLKRSGSTFTAYKSADGSTWTTIGSDTISMASTIYVGVAVSSHDYGVLATSAFASTATTTATTATATSTSTSSTSVRVLEWNTHHGGIGTDGVYDPARLASWIAKINPDVVALSEVDSTDAVNAIVSPLQKYTGITWHASFSGKGNLALSKLPLNYATKCLYDASIPAYAAQLGVTVNGRPINLFSIQLSVYSSSARLSEIKALQSCASNWPQARIIAGDFNMQYGSTEYSQAATNYLDAWLKAKSLGTAYNYPDNCDGCTRNSRIDYVFSSTGATFLTVKSAQIFDTRNSSGVMPSDHKPLLVIYNVN